MAPARRRRVWGWVVLVIGLVAAVPVLAAAFTSRQSFRTTRSARPPVTHKLFAWSPGPAAAPPYHHQLQFAVLEPTWPLTVSETIPQPVELKLLLAPSVKQLETEIRERGRRLHARVQLSPKMSANLSGPDVSITHSTPLTQAVGTGPETFWKWYVRANHPGPIPLDLTISTYLNINGQESFPHAVKDFPIQYTVQVVPVSFRSRVSSFLGNNWQWLWSAILVPVGLWLYRRSHPARPSPTPTPGSDQGANA
jgi:hypothetical protein